MPTDVRNMDVIMSEESSLKGSGEQIEAVIIKEETTFFIMFTQCNIRISFTHLILFSQDTHFL